MTSNSPKTTTAKPSASVSKLTFSDGHSIDLGSKDKVIIVGPNNSGKSLSLREIHAIASRGHRARTLAVKSMEMEKFGTIEDLREFLESEASLSNDVYSYNDWQLHQSSIERWSNDFIVKDLTSGFIKNITASNRLGICDVQASISPNEQKSKPQHVLYDSDSLMLKISGLFRRAFGEDIMFDYRGGSQLPIHVGELPKYPGPVDRVGDAYVGAVRSNPLLHEQGDGMKSFAGILFEAIVAARDIILIDEPEAFLHPPQMRQLGAMLASEVEGQLFVATHSSDIVRGFLEGTGGKLRILRIRREGNKNVVREAAPDVIRRLWDEPQLRYSNGLEGIFHEQTIFCEDDSDCRLINAVADHIATNLDHPWKDTGYVPTGGKHRIPDVAEVLRRIGVPVKAVFDIDFLSEKHLVKRAVEAFGGEWGDIETYWTRVDSAVRDGVAAKSIPEIKELICDLLQETEEEELPRNDVVELMKQNRPWKIVKRFGADGIPSGQAQTDYGVIRTKLEEIGIYLIPVGEIENFCRELGSHGPKFVARLLSKNDLSDANLDGLRSFVERVHTGPYGK